MSSSDQARFGYQIRPANDGWVWVTYDLNGRVRERGWAPEKALAAALVVRSLAAGAGAPVRSAA